MKVTALLQDDLVKSVNALARGRNLTESLSIALHEWVALKRIERLIPVVKRKPLRFQNGDVAAALRERNRRT